MNDGVEKKILIVKTSSLGDIIQAFDVLNYLHDKLPRTTIDWIVEERFVSIVAAHPLVNRAIGFNIKKIKHDWQKKTFWTALRSSIRLMRQTRYDFLFDLQGNCKSGVITALCRADQKVGFGKKSVREWPNLLATHRRFDVLRAINIRQQYVSLVQKFFDDPTYPKNLKNRLLGLAKAPIIDDRKRVRIALIRIRLRSLRSSILGCFRSSPKADFSGSLGITPKFQGVKFKIHERDREYLQTLLDSPLLKKKPRVMVCPGSKWTNKQMPLATLESFLLQIERALDCSFLLIWGAEEERKSCLSLHERFTHNSKVIDRMELPLWQNLMDAMDLVIAVDSSALHLCATTSTPSFSIFGPTSPDVFKPQGAHHYAFQGHCPYQRTFDKQCPILRTCSTGACIRDICPDQLFASFWDWWTVYTESRSV